MSAEMARRLVEAFHQPSTPVTGLDDVKLSRRGTKILEKISQGLANKRIADRLGLSVETVRGASKAYLRETARPVTDRSSSEIPRYGGPPSG